MASVFVANDMAHPNNDSGHPPPPPPNHHHRGEIGATGAAMGGWTAQQSREYNDLIQQQLGGAAGAAGAMGGGPSDASVGSLGSIPLQPGEMVEDPYERPTSAPPPGFVVGPGDPQQDRNRRAEEAIFGVPLKPSATHPPHPMGQQPQPQAHHHHHHHHPAAAAAAGLSHSSGLSAEEDAYSGVTGDSDSAERGFSLTNLVDALGSSLSDPVEDGGHQSQADALLRQRLADNPNLQRQTRHTASRLIGAGSGGTTSAPVVTGSAGGVSSFSPSDHGAFGTQSRLFTAAPSAATDERGFPNSLSSPSRTTPPRKNGELGGGPAAGKEVVARRATTPVQMHPGQSRDHRSYPLSKDIGATVDEPNDGESQFSGKNIPSGVVSNRVGGDPHTDMYVGGGGGSYHGAGGGGSVQSTLNSQSKEFRPSSHFQDANDGMSTLSAGTEISPHECEAELDPFLWELGGRPEPSRTVAILHASWLKPPEVRSECEQFGSLESFRAEFAPKGIFFASYYDLRSSELAVAELQARLQRIALLHGSSDDIMVRYCLPLNSSSQFNESQIIINGLSDDVNDAVLTSMLRSYGAIRACIYQGTGSYLIEFQNVQDAKQASLELESSLPWGPDVTVEVSPRNPADRRKGRELLSIISRWRQGMNRSVPSNGSADGRRFGSAPYTTPSSGAGGPRGQHPDGYGNFGGGGGGGFSGGRQPETVTQLIMGPDGRYTPVVVQNTMGVPSHGGQQYAVDPRGGQQQIIHGPNGQIFISSVPGQHMYSGGQGGYPPTVVGGPGRGGGNTPYYGVPVSQSDNISVHSGRSHGTHGTHGTGHLSHHSTSDDKDHRHLLLDLDAVENGRDTRTSLMVRNIPNKYTQQMLLSEFTENGHGPGVIDFFYLPIDFKNRCNRGYAFINFVNFQDILAFHRRYFGKQWRTFNSDKICDITYARIQGKAAMLKRFENSALMDKDDEYKPLVFASDGPDKGKRLPFAEPTSKPI